MMRMVCDSPSIIKKSRCQDCPKLDELARVLDESLSDSDVKVIVFSKWEGMSAARASKRRSSRDSAVISLTVGTCRNRSRCFSTRSHTATSSALTGKLSNTVRTLDSTIPAHHWAKLAQRERSPDQKIDSTDPDYATMLMNVVVLEYVNGDANDNPFESAAPWYAVHPIVRELRQFKEALAASE